MTSALPPLIIVCDWIPPMFGAVGQYEMARAEQAAASGRTVTLIGLSENTAEERRIDGKLRVVRILAGPPDKTNLIKRGLWALSVNNRLLAALKRAVKAHAQPCEIKVTGSPPFLSYQVLMWRQFNRAHRIVYRITDFYPETAFAAGKATAFKWLTPVVHALRRNADSVEALSQDQKRRLVESGVAPDRIVISRDISPVQFKADCKPAERPFHSNDVVLLYSGNLGVAHDWTTFAAAYRHHIEHGPNRVRLWLNATGVGVNALRVFCETHGLPVHVSAPVPLHQLAGVLIAADVHVILLGERFWGYVFPSKIYGCLASGKPCFFIGPQASDVHALLASDARHRSVRNGDVEGASDALAHFAEAYQSGAVDIVETTRHIGDEGLTPKDADPVRR